MGSWLVDDRRNRKVRLVPYYQWRRDEDDATRLGHSQWPTGPQLLTVRAVRIGSNINRGYGLTPAVDKRAS